LSREDHHQPITQHHLEQHGELGAALMHAPPVGAVDDVHKRVGALIVVAPVFFIVARGVLLLLLAAAVCIIAVVVEVVAGRHAAKTRAPVL
jgi:hypothetical protein